MLIRVLKNLHTSWRALIGSDLLFKAITFILLTPLVSLLFRLFLAASGRSVLADADIVKFLLHPLGWLAFVVVGGALVCVFALEQAVLITICIGAEQSQRFKPRRVVLFVLSRSHQLLQLTSRVVAKVGLTALPFLAIGGALYWLLLTDRDINFYLTHQPPKFWIACLLIGLLLVGLTIRLLQLSSGWVFATQLVLYENLSPSAALLESQRRAFGHRKKIAVAIAGWALLNSLGAFLLSLGIVEFGQVVVSWATGALWTLTLAVGFVIGLTTLTNMATSMVANASLGSLLGLLYCQFGSSGVTRLPTLAHQNDVWWSYKLTRTRGLAILVIGLLATACLGATAFHSLDIEDRVEITAHRGGAGVAPENTLAAIEQAILDETDWIEIDVQESADGVVVVAHDSDLSKVAGNPVKIWEATAAELRQIDIGSYFARQFSDQRIPTLEEVLQLCKGKVGVNIELKYYGHTQQLEQRVAELVDRYAMASQIVVMSLESRAVAKMKALRPEWQVGLLTAVSAGDLTRARADFLAVNGALATRRFIQSAHARNKAVAAWTINDGPSMSAMISRGVDNVITDYPALARRVLAERQELSPLERLMIELAFFLGVQPQTSTEND